MSGRAWPNKCAMGQYFDPVEYASAIRLRPYICAHRPQRSAMHRMHSDNSRPEAESPFTLWSSGYTQPHCSTIMYTILSYQIRAALYSLCLGVDALLAEHDRYCISHTTPVPTPHLKPLAFGCVSPLVASGLHIPYNPQRDFSADCGKG